MKTAGELARIAAEKSKEVRIPLTGRGHGEAELLLRILVLVTDQRLDLGTIGEIHSILNKLPHK